MELKKIILIIVAFLLVVGISYAVTSKFYVDIDMMSNDIINATWVNATSFNGTYYGDSTNLTEADVEEYINNTANAYFQLKVNSSNVTEYILCSGIKGGSDADFCTDDTGAAAATIWTNTSTWAWPTDNQNLNITQLNATNIYATGNINCSDNIHTTAGLIFVQGNQVLDVAATFGGDVTGTYDDIEVRNTSGLLLGNITDPSACAVGKHVTGKTGSAWDCSYPDWPYITNYDLNVDWSAGGTLGGGNITSLAWTKLTGYDLDVSWTNNLGHGNITVVGDWDIGAYELRAQTLESDVATGTAPFTIASTTQVANLNVSEAGDLICVDCIGVREISDVYLLLAGDTSTGNYTVGVWMNATNFNASDAIYADDWTDVAITETQITVGNDWDIGAHELRAQTLEADVTAGTAPLTVASSTVVANLNSSYAAEAYSLTCMDCLGATEITDIYLLSAGDTATSWINGTSFNASAYIYSDVHCFSLDCTHNITYNGTNTIVYG